MPKPSYTELLHKVARLEQEAERLKQIEAALRENEKKLSQIVQGNSIPTLVIDNDHVVTHCNSAYEGLTGISAQELIGTRRQWSAFYPSQRPILADFIVDRTPPQDVAAHYSGGNHRFTAKDGVYKAEVFLPDLGANGRWFFFTAAPLIDDDGNITGAIETFQDLTKRKRAEEAVRKSERRYRTLLDFVPYPVVVMTAARGKVLYLNPEFTKVFGWTLAELEGGAIPFVPQERRQETRENLQRLLDERTLVMHETQRLTKDGRLLDVSIKAALYSAGDQGEGVIAILRDVTQERRIARINEAILRISMALPRYTDLEGLLFYINTEVKKLLNTEGSIVILLDEERNEFFFLGAAYEDESLAQKAREIRFPAGKGVAAKVLRTGEPAIVTDTSNDPDFYAMVDTDLGYHSRNMLDVPLRSRDKIIGVMCAINKKAGHFDHTDIDLISIIEGTVALSVENARVSAALRKSYNEVKSLNRAKDKVINHLSHELKTPIAVLSGSLILLEKKLPQLTHGALSATLAMAKRNLERIKEIQYETEDIMQDRHLRTQGLLLLLLELCRDELVTLLALEGANDALITRVRAVIDDFFGPKELVARRVYLDVFVRERLKILLQLFAHRQVAVVDHLEPVPPIEIPTDPLQKVVDGLVKNAVENTPDEGRLEVAVHRRGEGVELVVRDCGVGITADAQKRIFEGFFATQETLDYSSKTPFDFNAGGKGADLLRMKIFAERYNFRIEMDSTRCAYIPTPMDICPGRISSCRHCHSAADCEASGGTAFTIYFPEALIPGAEVRDTSLPQGAAS